MKIAVDAMGGDYAPGVVVEGLALTVQEYPDYDFVLVGHREKVNFYLEKYGLSDNPHITVCHAESVCEMSDPSAIALRGKKDSSITTCAKLLKEGAVDAMVTPGHTTVLPPIQTLLPMVMGIGKSCPKARTSGSMACPTA